MKKYYNVIVKSIKGKRLMTKSLTSKTIVNRAKKSNFILKNEISLLSQRMTKGKDVDLSPLRGIDVYISEEQAKEELYFLRSRLLTKDGKKAAYCEWDDESLKSIGYNGDGQPLTELDPFHLVKFRGLLDIGVVDSCYTPIYEIGTMTYHLLRGFPRWINLNR